MMLAQSVGVLHHIRIPPATRHHSNLGGMLVCEDTNHEEARSRTHANTRNQNYVYRNSLNDVEVVCFMPMKPLLQLKFGALILRRREVVYFRCLQSMLQYPRPLSAQAMLTWCATDYTCMSALALANYAHV